MKNRTMSGNPYPLRNISQWSRSNSKCHKWLLIAGSSNPPESISVSSRRSREHPQSASGKYLKGINYDFANMENAIKENGIQENAIQLENSVRHLKMTKSEAKDHILNFFEICYQKDYKPMLYYTGHGEQKTGNWCFQDDTIGIDEIFSWCRSDKKYPTIISDACYSGNWAIYARRKAVRGFQCLSACGPDEIAVDTG